MNDGIILILAYPETIVCHPKEWFSKYLRYLFIGNKKYVRAGHAALVLIDKSSGVLEYYDFGRYITALGYGRVRGQELDFELKIPITAKIENNDISNLQDILKFFASRPDLTHGDGDLYGSVCKTVDYQKAKQYIKSLQNEGFVRYSVFKKNASNCSRFVTDTLIESVTDNSIRSKLKRSNWFTPSTIGNVINANTESQVYVVSQSGHINTFSSTVRKENLRLFLDTLKGYEPSLIGSLEPKHNTVKKDHAQWLSGIGTGAWFEIYDMNDKNLFRFRRVSPYGNVDCDGIYASSKQGFDIKVAYTFMHNSNCQFFHIEQDGITYRFEFQKNYEYD